MSVLGLVLLLGACNGESAGTAGGGGSSQRSPQDAQPLTPEVGDDQIVPLTPLDLGSMGYLGFSGPQATDVALIRNADSWAAWWDAHVNVYPKPPVPVVDFSANHVLISSSGALGNGCDSGPSLRQLEVSDGRLVATLNYPQPLQDVVGVNPRERFCTQAIEHHTNVYTIPRIDLPLVVKEEKPAQLGFTVVASGPVTSGEASVSVIRELDGWNAFWTANAPLAPFVPQSPLSLQLGYGSQGVRWFALASGPLPDGCHHRVIRGVYRYMDHYRVVYEDVEPAADQYCTAAIAHEATVVEAWGYGNVEDGNYGPVEWVPLGTDMTLYTPRP